MTKLRNIMLDDGTNVKIASDKKETGFLEALIRDKKIVHDIKQINSFCEQTDYNLLIYDKMIIYGLNNSRNSSLVGAFHYSPDILKMVIDDILSFRKEKIRVINKTGYDTFNKRLNPWTGLHWIEYNPDNNILMEKPDVPCNAKLYLWKLKKNEKLIALHQYKKKVYTSYYRIFSFNTYYDIDGEKKFQIEIGNSDAPPKPGNIDEVEKEFKAKTDALVIRSPLLFCTRRNDSEKRQSCLERLYIESYNDAFENETGTKRPSGNKHLI